MQETQRRFSRRRFFGVLGTVASASVIAACGNRTTSQPSAPAPTAAPAAGAATASATGSNGGPVVVWQTVDYIPSVTQLLRERFSAVAQEKGIQLTFEELPSGQASTDRFNAAVQAGTPPDIWRVFDYQTQYWRIQGQTLDLTDIVKPFASQQGGFWEPVELTAMFDGKWYGAPMAVNCWPFHVRQDLLDANGLAYPRSWTEFREQGRQLTKPPLYYYGQTLGRIDDTNNHFLGMLWTFGGKLQNEDGSLAVKAGDQAWIQTIETIDAMFTEDKIIPPGAITWDNTINNQSYQSEQLVLTSNPTSVYNWLERNKPELAQKTKFYSYPEGPSGSFGQVDVWSQALFKNGKGGDNARTILASLLDPTWYAGYINDQLRGRFVPVYRDMINADLWTQNDLYTEYRKIVETGRIMSYASAPLGAVAELTTRFIVGDMLQDVLVKRQSPAEALATFVRSAEEIYAKPENRR